MPKNQRGVSLLEVVLVIAILGIGLAYGGALLLKHVQQREVEKIASEIVYLQSQIKKVSQAVYLRVKQPNGMIQRQVNPLLIDPLVGWVKLDGDLHWMKKDTCVSPGGVKGLIPDNAEETFIGCSFSPNKMGLHFDGTHAEFVKYNNISFVQAKRFIKNAWSSYINASNKSIEDFLNIVTEIRNIKREDNFFIEEKNIQLAIFEKSGSGFNKIPGSEIALSELTGPNLDRISDYAQRVTAGGNYAGFYITSVYDGDIFIKRDGSIPMAEDASLCWDSKSGVGKPCIRASTDATDPKGDLFVVESGLAYGTGKKRTPIEASYQTFVNGQPLNIPYITCPNRVGDIVMENKMAAISSSYSSGSEPTTNFTNPGNIVSTGTLGAQGKHALVSGMSLEWNPDPTNKQWIIEGAVGFDGLYAAENGDQSVLRNPKSMSFIVLQWCEEI